LQQSKNYLSVLLSEVSLVMIADSKFYTVRGLYDDDFILFLAVISLKSLLL